MDVKRMFIKPRNRVKKFWLRDAMTLSFKYFTLYTALFKSVDLYRALFKSGS